MGKFRTVFCPRFSPHSVTVHIYARVVRAISYNVHDDVDVDDVIEAALVTLVCS